MAVSKMHKHILICMQDRLVAIDATVQRRPPGGLVSAEDAACNRLTELALNDAHVSMPVLTLCCKQTALMRCGVAASALIFFYLIFASGVS